MTTTSPAQSSWLVKLRRFLFWLNDLPIFNTEKWPAREWGTRIIAIVAAANFLYGRFKAFPAYLRNVDKMTTRLMNKGFSEMAANAAGILTIASVALMILIFLAYVLAWATRARAQKPARGFMEVVFPFIVAFLPMYLTSSPQTLSRWVPPGDTYVFMFLTIYVLMVGGFAMTFLSVLNLRTSFSIMAEARPLVRSGFFRFVRHPIYTGNFIMLLGALILHLGVRSILVYIALVVGHYFRARLEEKKLTQVYPEYEEYRRTTGMFLPRLSRIFTSAKAPAPLEADASGEARSAY